MTLENNASQLPGAGLGWQQEAPQLSETVSEVLVCVARRRAWPTLGRGGTLGFTLRERRLM